MTEVLLGTLISGAVYASVALGLVLIFRGTGVVNFAHGEAVAFGAFGAYVVIERWELGWPVAILVAIALGAAVGLLTERGLIHRLRNASELEIVVGTLALAVVMRGLLRLEFGSEAFSVAAIGGESGVRIGDMLLTVQQMITIGYGALIGVGCWYFLTRTDAGLAMRVSAADRDVAALLGIRTQRVYAGVWVISLAAAALAGALVAPQVFVSADMGFTPLLLGLTGAVLGGFGSFAGAVVGGYCVAFVETMASVMGSSEWQGTYAFVILLLVLMLRPDGLFGRPEPGRV